MTDEKWINYLLQSEGGQQQFIPLLEFIRIKSSRNEYSKALDLLTIQTPAGGSVIWSRPFESVSFEKLEPYCIESLYNIIKSGNPRAIESVEKFFNPINKKYILNATILASRSAYIYSEDSMTEYGEIWLKRYNQLKSIFGFSICHSLQSWHPKITSESPSYLSCAFWNIFSCICFKGSNHQSFLNPIEFSNTLNHENYRDLSDAYNKEIAQFFYQSDINSFTRMIPQAALSFNQCIDTLKRVYR